MSNPRNQLEKIQDEIAKNTDVQQDIVLQRQYRALKGLSKQIFDFRLREKRARAQMLAKTHTSTRVTEEKKIEPLSVPYVQVTQKPSVDRHDLLAIKSFLRAQQKTQLEQKKEACSDINIRCVIL